MISQKLNDFETLKKLVNADIKLNEIDNSTKERLIELCREQLSVVNEKIKDTKNRRIQLEKQLLKIKQGN